MSKQLLEKLERLNQQITPPEWFILEDGWPVWEAIPGTGALPYYAKGIDVSPANPYSPYDVSFDTLNGLCELRNLLPQIIEELRRGDSTVTVPGEAATGRSLGVYPEAGNGDGTA